MPRDPLASLHGRTSVQLAGLGRRKAAVCGCVHGCVSVVRRRCRVWYSQQRHSIVRLGPSPPPIATPTAGAQR